MFMFGIRVCGSCLVFGYAVLVWDSGLDTGLGLRFGVQVWIQDRD